MCSWRLLEGDCRGSRRNELIKKKKHLRNISLKRDCTSPTESPSFRSPLKNKAVFSINLVTIKPTSWKADLKIFKGFREDTLYGRAPRPILIIMDGVPKAKLNM